MLLEIKFNDIFLNTFCYARTDKSKIFSQYSRFDILKFFPNMCEI